MSHFCCYYHVLFSSMSFKHRPYCIKQLGFVLFHLGNFACEPILLFSFGI